jgi:hypothetical protein
MLHSIFCCLRKNYKEHQKLYQEKYDRRRELETILDERLDFKNLINDLQELQLIKKLMLKDRHH